MTSAYRGMSAVSLLTDSTSYSRTSSYSSNTTTNYEDEINAKRFFLGSDGEREIPSGKTSLLGAIFVVTNAAMGAGMLSFPYSFYLAGGWYWGISVEVGMIPIIIISLLILAYCSELKQSVTCEETLGLMLGPAAKITTEILVLLYCFGTCVAFLTVMGDQIEDVTFAFKYHNESVSEQWWANRKFLVPVVAIVLIYPWLYLRKIGILSYTSFLGILSCVYICLVIVVNYFLTEGNIECNAPKYYRSTDCSRSWTSFFDSIPFVCFAFQCHVSSIPVYSGLKKRSVRRFFFVIVAAVFLCTLLYSLTGSFGLITFSKKGLCINSDIMRNYCPTNIPVSVARGMLFLCLITSYPILAFCGRVSLDGFVFRLASCCCKGEHYSWAPSWLTAQSIVTFVNIQIWMLASLVLAVFVKEIKEVVSPLGSLAAVFIFVLPGLCLLKLSLQFHFNGKIKNVGGMIFSLSIVSFGVFIFANDLIYNIMEEAGVF